MQEITVGIDLGGTNVSFGIVKTNGDILFKKSFPLKNFDLVDNFCDFIITEIKSAIKSLNSNYNLKGLGIGAPNGNYYRGTIEHAVNLPWKGIVPLAKILESKLKKPVFLTNDANAATMGEMFFGKAKGVKDFIMLTLGTGLGSGFVANGELILGHDGFAGELGHTIFDPNGRSCNCGRKGCLEQYASATGIVKTVKKLLEGNIFPSEFNNVKQEDITSELVYKAALNNDIVAIKAFDYTAFVLGFMLANAVAITNPELIVLFGGLANAGDFILKPLKKYMEDNLLNVYKNKIRITVSGLPENDAAILGAAALAQKNK